MVRRALSWIAWPLLVAVWIGSAIAFARTAPPEMLGSFLGAASLTMIVVLVLLELVLPFRPDWAIRGDRDIGRDLGHYFLYTQVGGLTAQLLFVGGAAALLSQAGLEGGLGLWPAQSPVVVQVLLVIVLGDLLEYWTHRLSHGVAWLWPLHAIHHSPVRLSTLKAGRHHILYFWARGIVAWLPLLILGAQGEIILWQVVALGTTGILSHANVDFRIPAWVQKLVVTPGYHRIHHSIDSREGNSNFAVVLPVWDMLFGTYIDPTKFAAREVGMQDDPIPRAFLAELLSPFRWHRLVSNSVSKQPSPR